jgi:hypothetical protein
LKDFSGRHGSAADAMLTEALDAAKSEWLGITSKIRSRVLQVLTDSVPPSLPACRKKLDELRMVQGRGEIWDQLASSLRPHLAAEQGAW